MPRPGPRPYECVRRAWHSERHQPIRGSLIQELFRVVSEIHSPATKRNKEWQDKLPIVVLKAEEIMYSKATSEADYMDLNTLWDRANDAINTIIRRDDTEETGDLLQPCIEAALHLGCIPRRASRSERNNDPRCYLSPNPQEPMSCCHSNLKSSISSAHYMAMYSDMVKRVALSLSQLDAAPDKIPYKNFPLHFPPQTNPSQPVAHETCSASVGGHSVYPLYYWSCLKGDDPQLRCNTLPTKAMTHATDNISHPVSIMDTPIKHEVATISEKPQTGPPVSCDLSLRLGPCSGSEDIHNKNHPKEFRDTESKNPKSNKPHLFSKESAPVSYNEASKKRKALALAPCPAEEMQSCWQPKLPRNHYFTQRMRNPGFLQ
uniref:Histone acetyltransferase n=2 Tax=Kalanchoe fedtschenkoi TaxID=63787 RepID=A0A7N0T9E0_KALFE